MNSERLDELISRVVDRRESAADWDALAREESEHRKVWCELAQALRCDAELRSVMTSELARVEAVRLPANPVKRKALPTWSGWMAAAAILLAWLLATMNSAPSGAGEDLSTGDFSSSNREDALAVGAQSHEAPIRSRLDHSIITELPMVVVETKPASNGDGYDVVYLRRVLECRHVDEVLELAPDEAGGFRPVPVDDALLARPVVL